MCLYCDFLTVSSAMTNNWNVATINNWKHSHNCQAWRRICLQDSGRRANLSRGGDKLDLIDALSCLQNSFFEQTTLCLLWLMNFLDVYQVIHYGDEVDIDCILTDYFLHRSDSCELAKIFSLLSLISVLHKNWSRFLSFQRECGTHPPHPPPSHTRAPLNIIQWVKDPTELTTN